MVAAGDVRRGVGHTPSTSRVSVYIETLSRRRPRREYADVLSGPTPGHSRTTTSFGGTATTRNDSAQKDHGTGPTAEPRATHATGNSHRTATERNENTQRERGTATAAEPRGTYATGYSQRDRGTATAAEPRATHAAGNSHRTATGKNDNTQSDCGTTTGTADEIRRYFGETKREYV